MTEIFERYGVGETDDGASIVGEFISEFDKLDPGSFHFRYPKDRDGNLIQIDREQFDLQHLADIMLKVEHFFDGCDGYLDNLKYAGP